MARNVNVWISATDDGTKRNNIPDYLVHLRATWVNDAGEPQSMERDEYLLLALNWLRTTYPGEFRNVMQDVVVQIARLRYGVDSVEGLE